MVGKTELEGRELGGDGIGELNWRGGRKLCWNRELKSGAGMEFRERLTWQLGTRVPALPNAMPFRAPLGGVLLPRGLRRGPCARRERGTGIHYSRHIVPRPNAICRDANGRRLRRRGKNERAMGINCGLFRGGTLDRSQRDLHWPNHSMWQCLLIFSTPEASIGYYSSRHSNEPTSQVVLIGRKKKFQPHDHSVDIFHSYGGLLDMEVAPRAVLGPFVGGWLNKLVLKAPAGHQYGI